MPMAQPNNTPVVILAGGYGSRLGEATNKIPKPMVEIGGEPILYHIIRLWYKAGFREFIILGGYKIEVIREYLSTHHSFPEADIKLVDTGIGTQTGGRLLAVKDILPSVFCVSYGDGLTDFPLDHFLFLHGRYSAIVTMMLTHPISRFGEVKFNEFGTVTSFDEKPVAEAWISAGFFVFDKDIFDYIETEKSILEVDVFPKLVAIRNIQAVPNYLWWHCMDTPKDVKELNRIWEEGCAPWL